MYHKVVRAEIKAVNEAKGEVDAVVSTEKPDRSGDVIRQEFWDLKNFRKHPILLAGHDYRLLTSQIGEWRNVRIEGKQLVGTAVYYIGQGNEQADWGFQLAMSGKAAYSVGFILVTNYRTTKRMGRLFGLEWQQLWLRSWAHEVE
jgi:hypothetical protein